MLEPIIVKQVLDESGTFNHLELWQGNQHIKVSLASTVLDSGHHTWKWDNIKKIVDEMKPTVALDSFTKTFEDIKLAKKEK
jgi:hypothetical protein